MYEPKLGRFLSRDPLPENGVELLYPFPDMTRYAYTRNNPITLTDPSGLRSVTADTKTSSVKPVRPSHGPLETAPERPKCCPCKNLDAAIAAMNAAINGGGACQDWFDQHSMEERRKGPFGVVIDCNSIFELFGWPSYTVPQGSTLYVTGIGCKKPTTELASLLIHELAHHYCPDWPPRAREECATAAQYACEVEIGDVTELSSQAKSTRAQETSSVVR